MGDWPKEMEYVLCEDFNEKKMPKRNNLDLRKALQEVSQAFPIFQKPIEYQNELIWMEKMS